MDQNEQDRLFGEIGVDLGFVTKTDVAEALAQQKVDVAIGTRKPIGGYLYESGKLTKDQISKIISMQEKIEGTQKIQAQETRSDTNFSATKASQIRLQHFQSSNGREKKSIAVAVVCNVLWAGSGYFYLGKSEKGALWSIINLLFIWTGIIPIIICIAASVDANNIIQSENL